MTAVQKGELDSAFLRQQSGQYLKSSFQEAIRRCREVQTPHLTQLGLTLPAQRQEVLEVLEAEKEVEGRQTRLRLKEELKTKRKELAQAQSHIKKLNDQLLGLPQLVTAAQLATAALEKHLCIESPGAEPK
jgi:hypothetical protein